ncbi:MAG TPA: thermonuclease family protein, partial [Arenibaculum sp.]|nr:thermonuclease family protein [Arenibaculum sp.]
MLASLVVALSAPRAALPAGEIVRGAATAVDGDLLDLEGRELRLHAIDAPDAGQTCRTRGGREYDCGAEARAMLGRL